MKLINENSLRCFYTSDEQEFHNSFVTHTHYLFILKTFPFQ